jgi:hypothetical protein
MADEAKRRDRLVGLFVFGLILFSPPILLVFGRGSLLADLPLLYLYLFGAWAALIAAVAWIAEGWRRRSRADEE